MLSEHGFNFTILKVICLHNVIFESIVAQTDQFTNVLALKILAIGYEVVTMLRFSSLQVDAVL